MFDQIRSVIRIQRIKGTSYGECSLEKCFSRSSNLFNNMISFISHFEGFDVQREIVLGELGSVLPTVAVNDIAVLLETRKV